MGASNAYIYYYTLVVVAFILLEGEGGELKWCLIPKHSREKEKEWIVAFQRCVCVYVQSINSRWLMPSCSFSAALQLVFFASLSTKIVNITSRCYLYTGVCFVILSAFAPREAKCSNPGMLECVFVYISHAPTLSHIRIWGFFILVLFINIGIWTVDCKKLIYKVKS